MKPKYTFLGLIALAIIFSGQASNAYAESSLVPIPDSSSHSTVENRVREYFSDFPVMIEIARCESTFRQHNADGSALYGGFNNGMIGVFQVYERIHNSDAQSLGFDLSSLEGNLQYARHLYNAQGTVPWASSEFCWKNAKPLVSKTVVTKTVSKNNQQAQIDLLLQLVALLEQLLKRLA
jgi:hypothetical protein